MFFSQVLGDLKNLTLCLLQLKISHRKDLNKLGVFFSKESNKIPVKYKSTHSVKKKAKPVVYQHVNLCEHVNGHVNSLAFPHDTWDYPQYAREGSPDLSESVLTGDEVNFCMCSL